MSFRTLKYLFLSILLWPTFAHAQKSATPQTLQLKNLWALQASIDAGSLNTTDVKSLFNGSNVTLNDHALAFGFSLRLTRHVSNHYYLGLGFDSLTKSFRLKDSTAGINNLVNWIGLFPNALAGWSFYRSEHAFVSAESQVGWIRLNHSTFSQEGGSLSGNFSGSSPAWLAKLSATWFIIPSVGLHASVGYRRALISHVNFMDEFGQNLAPSTSTHQVDFSGPVTRLGISFYWGMKNRWGNMHTIPPPPETKPPTEAPQASPQ